MNRFYSNASTPALVLLLLVITGTGAGSVSAQDAEEVFEDDLFNDERVLEEIIVTARKRQESLQDTPVAISALSAEALQKSGVANIRDLQQQVPGLNFSEQGSKNPAIFIRGVGQRESNTALDPGVGVYINNIYIARTDGQLLDTVDTESIQVLRGPQGTLFGKNNTGGAMLVTTSAPHTEELEGYVSTRIGNFGRKDAKISANIPLNDDSLAVRFALNSTVLEGYLTSINDGKKYGDENRLAASARFYWQATDDFYADVFTYWSKQNERGAAFTCFMENPQSNLAVFSWPAPDGRPGGMNFENRCRESERLAGEEKILTNGPSRFKMTNEIAALTLSWEQDDLEVKSITAFSRQSDIVVEDDQDSVDFFGVNNGTISLHGALQRSLDNDYGDFSMPDEEERQQFSQELQLIGSTLDESLSYTVGLFYAREDLDNTVFSQLVGYNGYTAWPGFSSVIQKLLGTQSDLNNETYALFAQSTYDVTDWFQLTAGIRYTAEKREREATIYAGNCQAVVDRELIRGASDILCASADTLLVSDPADIQFFLENPPDYLPVNLVQEFETVPKPDIADADNDGDTEEFLSQTIQAPGGKISDEKKFSKVTPTITAAFNIPEDYFEDSLMDSSLIYLTWSEGFKAGGFEMKGLEMVQFDPEEVSNYELGWKMDALENRIRFNMATYLMKYQDMQIRIAEQGKSLADIFLFIANAGDATLRGIEMELMALPTDALTVQFSFNITDAKYDDFNAQVVDSSEIPSVTRIVDRSDEKFGSVPQLTYSLSLAYDIDTNLGRFTPRATLYYKDEVYTGIDNFAAETKTFNEGTAEEYSVNFEKISTLDDVLLLNFRLAFTPVDESFNITVFVNNVTDEDWFQGGFTQAGALGGATVTKGAPKTYGLEAILYF